MLSSVCLPLQDGLKDRKAARDKEVNKQKVYDKVRRDNPNDSRKVNRAVEEMQTARQEAAQVAKKAEEHMTAYELQKLKDTKVGVCNTTSHNHVVFLPCLYANTYRYVYF